MARRVVITGYGMLSCFGIGHDAIWEAVCDEACGIDHITRFDVTEYDSQIAAQVPDFEMDERVDPKLSKRADRFTQFALQASQEALDMAGIERTEEPRDDIGVLIGSGIGGMETWEEQYERLLNRGPGRVSPFLVPMLISDMASGLVSIMIGARGPNLAAVTACASATHSTGLAFDMIRHGRSEIMVTGGSEAAVTKTALSGFCSARALSTRNDAPKDACRPMDRDRDGFVIGEGCTIVILEELEHAKARGADIYGELIGFGMSGDAYHITAPEPEGTGAVLAMEAALKDAGLTTDDIDYINAHAPGTPPGDAMEGHALLDLFGEDTPPVSSTKGNHGHQLGATGATELILSLTMAHEGYIPPTLNCENPDDFMTFDIVRGQGREVDIATIMSNSFGFGGHNAVLIATTAGY
ncbi:MAG: beta-ketoacyl-ACP synthase II [Armatimonadota bacterium]